MAQWILRYSEFIEPSNITKVTLEESAGDYQRVVASLAGDATTTDDDIVIDSALRTFAKREVPDIVDYMVGQDIDDVRGDVDSAVDIAKEASKSATEASKSANEAIGSIDVNIEGKVDSAVSEKTQSLSAEIQALHDELDSIVVKIEELSVSQKEELDNKYPVWEPGISLGTGDKVHYDGVNYEVIQAHASQEGWEPDITPSLFKNLKVETIGDDEGGETEVIEDFVQPTGAHDSYTTGEKVVFDGEVYESTMDNNTYSPSDYPQGWTTVE